jgi:actin related protein 2/3 complex subunit 2
VSDFDGVTFHISTPEAKSKIVVSIQIRCYKELLQYGAQQVLEREYGPYVIAPEAGYDFSVQVNLDDLPEDKGIEILRVTAGYQLILMLLYRSPR